MKTLFKKALMGFYFFSLIVFVGCNNQQNVSDFATTQIPQKNLIH